MKEKASYIKIGEKVGVSYGGTTKELTNNLKVFNNETEAKSYAKRIGRF
jgi:hypothetical protein